MGESDNRFGYWSSQRVGRRRLIRGAALGGAGILGAALVGCGEDEGDATAAPTASPTGTTAGGGLSTATAAATSSDAAQPGGTLRLGYFADDVPLLSVMNNGAGAASLVQSTLHADTYVYGHSDGTMSNMLWESYEWQDPEHLAVSLRPGLTFQDGSPLNAEEMKWSIETLKDPERAPRFTTLRGLLALVDSVDAVNETDAIINLKTADYGFVSNLVLAPGMPFSRAQVEKLGEAEYQAPRYAGPFTVEDAVPGTGWKGVKFENYWGGNPGMESWVDEFDIRVITENQTRGAGLESGEFEAVAFRESDQTVVALLEKPEYDSVLFDRSPHGLTINHVAPPLDDLRVRKAIAHALDRDKVRTTLFGGLGDPSYSLILPFIPGWKQADPYGFDPAKAKAELAAAGYSDTNRPKVVYALQGSPPTSSASQAAALYQEMLNVVGIDVEIQNVTNAQNDLGEAVPYIIAGDFGQRFDAFASWTLRASYEGSIGFRSKVGEDKVVQDKINELVFQGRATEDQAERNKLSEEIGDLYHQNVMGTIPVTRTRGALIANNSKVGGMDHPDMGFPLGSSRPRFLWLKS